MDSSEGAADRVMYARDLYPRHHLAVRAGNVATHVPRAVCWPRTVEDVVRVVRYAVAEGASLVPFGGGSGVCAGVLPTRETIVVDMKRMAAIRAREGQTVVVEAGAMGLPFEETLEREGLTLGHFPSSIGCSTVGGWIAARSAGQASGFYGKIEDMVVALECVTGTGEVVRLVNRPHGPSLVPAVLGSEGTLAIVTAAKLRLHAAPTERAFGAWSVASMRDGIAAMREIFQQGQRPAVLRLYDPFDAMLARRDGHEKRGAPGGGMTALRALLGQPSAFNALVDSRLGERVMGGALLVAVFDRGDNAAARAIVEGAGGRWEGEGPARRWLEHRYDVSYRQSPLVAQGLFLDTMEVAARWSRVEALYDEVRRAIEPHAFVMAHMSHAYPDGCCIYFSFAGGAPWGSRDWNRACEERYDAIWHDALAACERAGGVVAHHHGVGRSKAGSQPPSALVRALKRAFDPHGVLNPGAVMLPVAPDPFARDT